MEKAKITAQPRTTRGTRVAKIQRAAGELPAIIYGHGQPPEAVTLHEHEVEVALAHGARTLEVELNGKTSQYLIKEVQYDHLGIAPIHIDLARVDIHEKVQVTVEIELRGVPKGLSEGGMLEQLLMELEIECAVSDIPNTLHPLINDLGLGDVLLVKDLELPPGVVALTNPEERVALVKAVAEEPEEEEAEAAEGESPEEPERIGRVREEEEGGGS